MPHGEVAFANVLDMVNLRYHDDLVSELFSSTIL